MKHTYFVLNLRKGWKYLKYAMYAFQKQDKIVREVKDQQKISSLKCRFSLKIHASLYSRMLKPPLPRRQNPSSPKALLYSPIALAPQSSKHNKAPSLFRVSRLVL